MASDYLKTRHDIAVTNVESGGSGSDLIGMMLAQKQDGSIAYEEYDAQTFADQFFTGAASPVNVNPEEELILTQDDWRSGFGLEYYDPNDPLRYRSSIGMDLSNKGMAIAGPTPTQLSAPDPDGVPEIINPGMELATGWDVSDTNVTYSTAQKEAGAQSIRIESSTDTASQYLLGWTPGVQYTFTAQVRGWGNSSYKGYIGISDGVSSDSWSTGRYTTSFDEETITHEMHANAKYLKIIFKVDTGGGVNHTYFDTAAISVADSSGADTYTGVCRAWGEFNDKLWFVRDTYLCALNSAGDRPLTAFKFSANITDLEAFTDDRFYIALGFSTAYEYMDTNYKITTSDRSTDKFQFFKTVHTTADTMYGNASNNEIYSLTTPHNNNGTQWTGPTTVGDDANDITRLEEKSGALYIMKTDMPYYLDSDGNPQNDLAEELKTDTSSTSGKATFLWKKKLYINAGDQVLLETDGTTNTFRNPADYSTSLPDFVGAIQGLAGDGFWLFVIVDNSDKIEVLKCRDETIGSTTSWVIHPFAEITLSGCERAFVSSVCQKRLWISSTKNTDSLYYVPLPTGYGDIAGSSNIGPETLRPDAAGDETAIGAQFPDTGEAHWENVDEETSDQTATYVKNPTTSYQRDLYNLPASSGSGTINKITVYFRCVSSILSSGAKAKASIKSNSTVTDGDEESVPAQPSAFETFSMEWATNPADSQAWGWSDIDALQIGVSLKAGTGGASPSVICTQVYVVVDYVGYAFKTGTTFETSWLHGNFKTDNKAWIKLTLTMGHTYNAGRYFQVKYKKYGDSSWSSNIGNFTGAEGDMVQSRFIDTSNKPFSSMMKFQFTAVTNDTDYTPVLHRFEARAVMYPKIRRLIHCVVRCNDYMTTKDIPDIGKYSLIKTTLDNARNNPVWPISIRDIDGSTVNVKFLPVPKSMQRLLITRKPKDMRHDEREYHILMLAIDLS